MLETQVPAGMRPLPHARKSHSCTAYFDSCALALAASQSALLISRNPCPLHEFWPLHELLALLQADCPLQELTPAH